MTQTPFAAVFRSPPVRMCQRSPAPAQWSCGCETGAGP